jgi:hypothetical protein
MARDSGFQSMVRRDHFLPTPRLCLWVSIFGATVAAELVCYGLLTSLTGDSPISYEYHMTMYPELFPAQYAAAMALPYSILATAWATKQPPRTVLGNVVRRTALIGLAFVLGGGLCGILWVVHDMQAGYVPPVDRAIRNIVEGAVNGVGFGVRIALRSYPLNIMGIMAAYGILSIARLLARLLRVT